MKALVILICSEKGNKGKKRLKVENSAKNKGKGAKEINLIRKINKKMEIK